MKVSLIIVTKDRPEDMQRCLESAAKQVVDWHKVIIVDASDDPIESIVKKYSDQLPITYLKSKPGITKQRNFGIKELQKDSPDTDIVLFIDDDVRLSSQTVQQLQNFFHQKPTAAGVTGILDKDTQHSWLKKIWGYFTLLYTAKPYGYTAGIFNIINPAQQQQIIEWLPGAFMAYRYDVVKDQQFDEWFTTYGLGEDFDYSFRAQQHGKLYVEPSIDVEHIHSEVGRNWQRFGYMRIVNRYYLKNKLFSGKFQYWLGYWWSTLWLIWINALRATYSKRYRAEFIGNLRGLFNINT